MTQALTPASPPAVLCHFSSLCAPRKSRGAELPAVRAQTPASLLAARWTWPHFRSGTGKGASPRPQPPHRPAKANSCTHLVLSSPVTKLRSSEPTWSPSGKAEHRSEAENRTSNQTQQVNVPPPARPAVLYFTLNILVHNVLDTELRLPQGLRFKVSLNQAQIQAMFWSFRWAMRF